ncbi:MAG: hypothetical protein JRE64_00515 [Deltaproteobacteria bacterium]|nr:hypothetical protein [Deltaproteobacteria bacterium]
MALTLLQHLIKSRLNRVVHSLRGGNKTKQDVSVPRFSKTDNYYENGQLYRRHVVILMSRGCSVATCTMCPFTNYNLHGMHEIPASPVDQLEQHFKDNSGLDMDILAVYNDGSFFSNHEIMEEERFQFACFVRNSNIPHLHVESLPQFLTPEQLVPFCKALSPTRLTVGIGLQSASHVVQKYCVNTTVSKENFELAVNTAKSLGVCIKPYVMIKPPFLTDFEAITDVTESAKYLAGLGLEHMTLCPTRIAENTLAHSLFEAGFFFPPDMLTVFAALKKSTKIIESRVATQNLIGGDFDAVMSGGYDLYQDRILLNAIFLYNKTGTLDDLRLPKLLDAKLEEHIKKACPIVTDKLFSRINYQLSMME